MASLRNHLEGRIQTATGPYDTFRAARFACSVFGGFLWLLLPYAVSAETLYEINVSKFLMGTQVETTARHSSIRSGREALYRAYQEMERVEALLSSHSMDSEVALINRLAGIGPSRVQLETLELIERAITHANRLDGRFDVTIGPLTERWGFSGEGETTLPTAREIELLRGLVDWRRILVDRADTTVFLQDAGMRLDLGGIAKGYAIDRGVAVLNESGIRHFILNAGGDVHVSGQKNDGPWRVGVRHPREANALIAQFDLTDYSVATSGDYERFKVYGGKRYHHVLDPLTGYPGSRCQSVTVLAPTAEAADVLATYLFLKGELSDSIDHPHMIVRSDGVVTYRGFPDSANLQILDQDSAD
jgi:FAD:protein FMN transferase